MIRSKTGSAAQVPAGSANTHQGVTVRGSFTGEADAHPTITWVTKP